MKIDITFSGDTYEDREEIDIILSHQNLYSALKDYKDFLRGKHKYGEFSEEVYSAWEEAYERFYEICNQNKVEL